MKLKKEFWIYLTNDQGCAHVIAVLAETCKPAGNDAVKMDGHFMRFSGLTVEEVEEAKKETHHLMLAEGSRWPKPLESHKRGG